MRNRLIVSALFCFLITACGGSNSPPAPGNVAPTISSIADRSISANITSAPIAFSVTSSSDLAYSVSSDNEQVVPNGGISLVNDASSGSITVSPVPDTVGDAFVTIIATDQMGLSASSSFLLTVVPQQLSFQQFVRNEFALVEDGMPALINVVVFDQDAAGDDFADLIAQ